MFAGRPASESLLKYFEHCTLTAESFRTGAVFPFGKQAERGAGAVRACPLHRLQTVWHGHLEGSIESYRIYMVGGWVGVGVGVPATGVGDG